MLIEIHLAADDQFFEIFLRDREAVERAAQPFGLRQRRTARKTGVKFSAPFI